MLPRYISAVSMQELLRGLEYFSSPYIDDIIIVSVGWDDHLIHINSILERLSPHGCQSSHASGVGATHPLSFWILLWVKVTYWYHKHALSNLDLCETKDCVTVKVTFRSGKHLLKAWWFLPMAILFVFILTLPLLVLVECCVFTGLMSEKLCDSTPSSCCPDNSVKTSMCLILLR